MTRITYIPNRVIDTDGIADGASIYVYQSGGTTPVSLFSDSTYSTPVSNPYVVASGAVIPALYTNYSGSIRVRIVSDGGQVPLDEDPYVGIQDLSLQNPDGSTRVKFLQAGTGAVARTLQTKLREYAVSVMDFGATGDGETDDTAAIQAAIDFVESTVDMATHSSNSPAAGPQTLFFPAGLYLVTDALVITKSMSIVGDGHSEYSSGARIQQQTSAKDIFRVEAIAQGASVSWTDLTLRANGGGGTGGALINITKPTLGGQSNSCRIVGCTFGTPQTLAIKVQRGDDLIIENCLFDVSALQAIGLGTSTAADVVTNVRISNCDFYDISQQAILVYNVDGLVIEGNTVFSHTSTASFVDAANTLPYQIKNVTISNNTFKRVKVIAYATAVQGFVVSGNSGDELGGGSGATTSLLEFTGTCAGIIINGNRFSGNVDAQYFYDDTGATVTEAVITSNSFKATGGTAAALRANNTGGSIGMNTFTGFAANCIGHRWATTSSGVAPGVVALGASSTVNITVAGVLQGDIVHFEPSSTSWIAPDGFVVTAYVSASNQISLKYTNVGAADPTGVPAHDVTVMVTR